MCDDPVPIFCYKDYIARIPSKLNSAAGLSEVDDETLKSWLLRHRVHSVALCEERGGYVQWLINDSPPYTTQRALNVGCALAVMELPWLLPVLAILQPHHNLLVLFILLH